MHMAPEQIRAERATVQSDVYAVGVLLYELIAGEPPLRGGNTYETLRAHLEETPRPLREVRQDIPETLSKDIAKALEKDPARRFASAALFAAALLPHMDESLARTSTLVPNPSWQRVSTDELSRPTASFHAPVQELVKHLASFIGPIAKVVVGRLLRQSSDLDQLYTLAAKEIDGEKDRERFLRTRPNPEALSGTRCASRQGGPASLPGTAASPSSKHIRKED